MKSLIQLSKRHHAALLSAEWFASLSSEVRDDVLAKCRLRGYADKQRVHARGNTTESMYCVLEGCLRFSGMSGNQRSTVLNFYGPGTWVGEVAALTGCPRMYDADAYGRSVVLVLGIPELNALLAAHPTFCRGMLQLAAERLHIVLTAIEQYSTQSLENRLATRFVTLSKSFGVAGHGGIKLDLRLSQETLAQLIGATRQRVNQILLDWEQQGILRQKYGRTVILSPSRLEKLAKM